MDDPAFATPDTDLTTQFILLASSNHDLAALKPLLRVPGKASVQDPETGFTPLHAAISACGPAAASITESAGREGRSGEGEGEGGEDVDVDVDMEKAKKVVEELFFSGAIWNDLDANGETPACLAWRLGRMELYEMCVCAGVRAELLLGLMEGGGYEVLEGEGSDEEEGEDGEGLDVDGDVGVDRETQVPARDSGAEGAKGNSAAANKGDESAAGPRRDSTSKTSRENGEAEVEAEAGKENGEKKQDVNSAAYLSSALTFTQDALLDADNNGVMMTWETSIMRRTVELLLPAPKPGGARILNIGFGMGIIDRLFRATQPLTHHIIEAHPAVLARLSSDTTSDFGPAWEKSAPAHGDGGSYKIHAGKWQDICPLLLQQGQVYDAIYFDTFGEDYSQLKLFFTEFLPGLLDADGRFGWFNGLGADRRVCYDVYCRVVEMHLLDAGCDVEWEDVEVQGLGGEGEGEWKGVRRRYWVLDKYRLPVCRFLG
ncbi:hypothetical protein LZ554_002756 [Drepanopeziza brunnea f. sp. 'monogermtubi']|nr:hypothetical protein LZ554_002756 [Drepanopeziza brunnea f. sp. 'monogermtubi']